MMYSSLYHILISAIVGPVLHNFVDACGRTPARTQPRPQTTASPPPQTASPSPVTPVARHQQKCTAAEEMQAACLNGECYALDLDGGNRSAFCQCPELYEGSRCEQLSDDFFVLYAGEVKKAGIAAGVVVLVIILTIIIVYFAIKRRKRRKREQERSRTGDQEAQMNGNAAQPLMKEGMHTDSERIALNGMEKSPETNV
ncbi:probetacellulin-like isoform X2 [Littorina saxatilis]|uniref:EGF-like domain-containing protein n=1 Tax=Littorina saxatilis TaxID=31220 RepID=A0AAN9BT35_9CAEN